MTGRRQKEALMLGGASADTVSLNDLYEKCGAGQC